MEKLPASIVISGKALGWCFGYCTQNFFGAERVERLWDEFERRGFLFPKTMEDLKARTRLLRSGMRRPYTKREQWVSRSFSPEIVYCAFCGLQAVACRIKDSDAYRVSTRWTPTMLNVVGGASWPPPKQHAEQACEAVLSSLDSTVGYLRWEESGGSPDLARWLVLFRRFGQTD